MKKTYRMDVECAACANKMEKAIQALPGVKEAAVSFITQKLIIELEEGADVSKVMQAANKCCKKIESDARIYL